MEDLRQSALAGRPNRTIERPPVVSTIVADLPVHKPSALLLSDLHAIISISYILFRGSISCEVASQCFSKFPSPFTAHGPYRVTSGAWLIAS